MRVEELATNLLNIKWNGPGDNAEYDSYIIGIYNRTDGEFSIIKEVNGGQTDVTIPIESSDLPSHIGVKTVSGTVHSWPAYWNSTLEQTSGRALPTSVKTSTN